MATHPFALKYQNLRIIARKSGTVHAAFVIAILPRAVAWFSVFRYVQR